MRTLKPHSRQQPEIPPPSSLRLGPNGWIPNNPRLPVLHYRAAFPEPGEDDPAISIETRLRGNGWPPQWRDGIYNYHHYHSAGHEVLGVARGHATVMLGGPGGDVLELAQGDVVLLPAGTGHCCLSASADLLVVGAYPPGQQGDICTHAPSPTMLARISALDVPASDPVSGPEGPSVQLWPT